MNRVSLAVCVLLSTGGLAWGQSGKMAVKPAKPTPVVAPAKPVVPATPDAKAILAACAKAVAELKAFSYLGDSVDTADAESGAAAYTAEVAAARADAGGWKLYVKGEARSGKDGKTMTPFHLAYDGATAKSIREKDKVVIERELESMEELATFFSGQSARHPVAWEMLSDNAFTKASSAVHEGTAQVAGVECDIVLIDAPAVTKPDAKPDAKPDSKPAAKPAAVADTVVNSGTRLFIATSDHLPRKIERLRTTGSGDTKVTKARVLTMGEFHRDSDAALKAFSMNVPDGYRVRAPESGGGAGEKKITRGNPRERTPANEGGKDKPKGNGLLAVGDMAPDWTLKDAAGVTHTLSDKKGKVVVMDFWATWCGPCKAAMPAVQRLHKKLGGESVEIFGVNTFERGDAPGYMKKSGFTYGCLLKGDSVATKYNVSGIPTFYVIGPDGKILWNAVGFSAEHEKEIADVIAKAAAK